jgi:hypothetical protein
LYDLRGLNGKLDKLLDSVTVFTEEELVPIMIGGVHTKTLNEMRYDNQTMIDINNHHSRLRKVAFYGVEDAPECWRVISNLTDTAAEDYDIWEATKDNFFINKAQEALDNHIGEMNANNLMYKAIKNTRGWLYPEYVILSGGTDNALSRLKTENRHRQDAIDFLNNANTEWRYLIGSYHRDSFTYDSIAKYVLTWQEKHYFLGKWYNQSRTFWSLADVLAEQKAIPGRVYKSRNVYFQESYLRFKARKFYPSDGVILCKSQVAFPGAPYDHKPISNEKAGDSIYEMFGNNHFQERNSPQAKEKLELLYSGFFDTYFKVKKAK